MTDGQRGSSSAVARTRSIEDFRGDVDDLSSMVQDAWRENPGSFLYTPDFLSSILSYPGVGPVLAPTLYEDGKPMAFVAGFPRRVMFDARPLTIVVSSLLSVSSRYQKSGMGAVMLGELIKRARKAGFDGMVQYCVDGGPMNGIVLGLGQALKTPTERLMSVTYLSRTIFPKQAAAPEALQADISSAADVLMEGANFQPTPPLTRLWTRAEAEWQCSRDDALFAELKVGDRRGVLTGYIMRVADSGQPKCLVIDDILWGTLAKDERPVLVTKLVGMAAAAGAQLAIAPVLGYADLSPLEASRFRPSKRVLHAYLSVWTGETSVRELTSMYIDVF